MRSAGCAINDYADRHFDGHVRRTCERPLAAGAIAPKEAVGVFVVLSLVSFGLVLTLNALTIANAFVALALAAIYPFMKRHHHLPQLFLGAAFGWAVPMAFTAIQETVPLVGWVLFAIAVLWALIYDTMYAMTDREDDLKIGIKSSAILFGHHDRLILGAMQLLMLALLWWVGELAGLGAYYLGGMAIAAGLFGYQQWLIRGRDPAACFRAFLNNHYLGMWLFICLALDYLAA
jgi:4-hydroxybenzoate polyprenyltransferase